MPNISLNYSATRLELLPNFQGYPAFLPLPADAPSIQLSR